MRHGSHRLVLLAVVLSASVGAVEWWGRSSQPLDHGRRWAKALPAPTADTSYVSSDRCQSCHPRQYGSWHATYHRTMTQVATPANVRGAFDDRTLVAKDGRYRLFRRGDTFWVSLDDPDAAPDEKRPRVERRVVMTTGSHHQQRYWLESGAGRRLDLLPFAYLLAEARWVPGEAIFLTFPYARHGLSKGAWNEVCSSCHGTGSRTAPNGDLTQPDTEVAELGIACEACHGPAAEHVAANHFPLRRYWLHASDDGDSTIVNPSRLEPKRSAEVCGQCHSINRPLDPEARRLHGDPYRPGHVLEEVRHVVVPGRVSLDPVFEGDESASETSFWPDGTARVSGREYNGLVQSGCFQRGAITCLSCHSMHDSDPNQQLASGMDGDQACLQCHAAMRTDASEHTHHAADSAGSRCYNCHMPNTTHGLLRAMRSHRIDSPSAAVSAESGRPNACNLCHLDRTLGWTARHLSDWYGTPPVALNEDQQSVSAAVLWMLEGDAIQRAITTWHMGWGPALEASGTDWEAPFLAELLDDPYAAVRFNAGRSLHELPGFDDYTYDYLGSDDEQRQAQLDVLRTWSARGSARVEPAVLMEQPGIIQRARLELLHLRRDDRYVRINE
jgi:predicted CXXCH cytochrome family protein